MSRDEIIRMAREAGFNVEQGYLLRITGIDEDLERFAALVAAAEREIQAEAFQQILTATRNDTRAAEREACCSGEVLNAANINGGDHPHQVIEKYQAAIRARGQA